MSFSSKASRRHDNILCREATKVIVEPQSSEELLIAQQETAMWNEYRAWLHSIYHPSIPGSEQFIPHEDSAITANDETDGEGINSDSKVAILDGEEVTLDTHSRFEVTDSGSAHVYPTGKPGHTTDVRRYLPSVKKSDSKKIHGKLKGQTRNQMKKAGTPFGLGDLNLLGGETDKKAIS